MKRTDCNAVYVALQSDKIFFNATYTALLSDDINFNATFMALKFDYSFSNAMNLALKSTRIFFNAMFVALKPNANFFNAVNVALKSQIKTFNATFAALKIPFFDNNMYSDNHPQKKDIKDKKPYHTGITLDDVLRYRPDDASTHTSSLLVNAVADILYTTNLLECNDIASYMSVDARTLASAIKLELEMSFHDLVQQYRLAQVRQFLAEHPDYKNYKAEELATAIGYSSSASISRFLKKHLGITPKGRKSVATDRWTQSRSEIRAERSVSKATKY